MTSPKHLSARTAPSIPAPRPSRRATVRFLAAYTVLFLIIGAAVFAPFALAHKSFVWLVDGLDQHFNAFVWLGATVRQTIRDLIAGKGFAFPLWEWGLGYGGDSLTTLSYYVVGDPFALISIVTPTAKAEAGYAVAIIARLWCAGAALSFYCRERGCERRSTLVASLSYAFCAFALFASVRHPYFANPLVFLPLILDGMERLLAHGSPLRYTLWLAVAAISNYYFLYMIVIVTVLYAALRYPSLPGASGRGFLRSLARGIACTLLGLSAAGVILIPSAYAFVTCSREVTASAVDPLYPLSYYRDLARSAFTSISPGYWTNIGVTPLFLLAFGTLASRCARRSGTDSERRERVFQLAMTVIFTLFLIVPFFGHVFNGFGYMTNRWTFAWAFLACFLIARWLPSYADAPSRERLAIGIGSIALSILAILVATCGAHTLRYSAAAAILLALMAALLPAARTRPLKTWANAGAAVAIAASIILMARYQYVASGYLDQFHESGTDLAQLSQATSPLDASDVARTADAPVDADGAFYRLDRPSLVNALASSRVSTTSAYWSVMPAGIGAFMQRNASYQFESYTFLSLENRSLLLPLANARYYAQDSSSEQTNAVPYGYREVSRQTDPATGTASTLYASSLSLPFGWTTTRYVTERDYEQASIAERQQMMLQAVVVDDGTDVSHLEHADPSYTDAELPFTLSELRGATLEGDVLTVTEPGASLTLDVVCPAASELYAQLLDATFVPSSTAGERATLSWVTATDARGKQGRARMLTPYDAGYDGRTDYVLNMGYSESGRSGIVITFSEPGTYSIGSLSIIAQPTSQIDAQIEDLSEQPLRNVAFGTNAITGDIELSETRVLCLSLPYSEGWSATDNGVAVPLVRADDMYTGLVLGKGSHHIELTYMTPYLPLGAVVSACSVGMIAVLAAHFRIRRSNDAPSSRTGHQED